MSSPCPVCLNAYGTVAVSSEYGLNYQINCPICGKFTLERSTYEDYLDPLGAVGAKLTQTNRARISHKIRPASDGSRLVRIEPDFLARYIAEGCPGPSPQEQAITTLRYLGDEIKRTGEKVKKLENWFFVLIGSPNPTLAGELLLELAALGQIDGIPLKSLNNPPSMMHINLTLRGWKAYEDEQRGRIAGKYGFLAMKFGDPLLDPLARDVIKPTLKTSLGFDVFDMRDVARAGVIDNIMRAQIRDAAFVIVDLTHDNSGAYWEAGYAEGLGKPVIYICEKDKFEAAKTHFDTNHCTTVVWNSADAEQFKHQLVATLRRSLNLF